MYQTTNPLTHLDDLTAMLDQMHPSQVGKVIAQLDRHCRAWIGATTFVTIASCDAAGNLDVSPKGDPAGFVKVLDDKTLIIPDRIGNQRMDTFRNVLQVPRVGTMFVVPKRKEVLRINGAAELARDEALLDMTIVNGHRPDLVLLVRVEEAFFHCGKAMIRSAMWQPEKWGPVDDLPSYAQALKDHGRMAMALDEIEARMAYNESDRLY